MKLLFVIRCFPICLIIRFFRKKCPTHQANYRIYKRVESAKAKNDSIASRTGSFRSSIIREAFIKCHPYINIDKSDILIHKKMTSLLNRKRQFLLTVNKYVKEFNSTTQSCTFDPRAQFSKTLLLHCSKFFISSINEFQVTEKPPEAIVKDRIEKHNSEHYTKLPKNEMLKFYSLLKNSSFEELMKTGPYSRATFYRYKSRFEKIGITQNNIMPNDFIHSKIDLGQYHHHIIYGKRLINK